MPSPDRTGDPRDDGRAGENQDPRPRLRPTAAALLGVEALLLTAAATYSFLGAASGAISGRFGTGLGVFLLLFALAVGVAARSILSRGRFGLGFGITWQLFQALVGVSLLRGALYWPGALALVLSIAAFAVLTQLVRSTPLPGREDQPPT